MGLVYHCQGVVLPRLSLESCEEDKKLRRLGEVPAKMELADA